MATEIVNRQRRVPIDRERVAALGNRALAAAGRADASITVAFVRDPVIRRLNRDYRGKELSTDVLSFPVGDGAAAIVNRGPQDLGDIVISTDAALRQANQTGYSLEREISELVLHGVLHLCGYDHEIDRGEMNRLELKLRRRLLREG